MIFLGLPLANNGQQYFSFIRSANNASNIQYIGFTLIIFSSTFILIFLKIEQKEQSYFEFLLYYTMKEILLHKLSWTFAILKCVLDRIRHYRDLYSIYVLDNIFCTKMHTTDSSIFLTAT